MISVLGFCTVGLLISTIVLASNRNPGVQPIELVLPDNGGTSAAATAVGADVPSSLAEIQQSLSALTDRVTPLSIKPPAGENPCAGTKPKEGFDNAACFEADVEDQAGADVTAVAREQAGANVTAGYVGNLKTDAVPITDDHSTHKVGVVVRLVVHNRKYLSFRVCMHVCQGNGERDRWGGGRLGRNSILQTALPSCSIKKKKKEHGKEKRKLTLHANCFVGGGGELAAVAEDAIVERSLVLVDCSACSALGVWPVDLVGLSNFHAHAVLPIECLGELLFFRVVQVALVSPANRL